MGDGLQEFGEGALLHGDVRLFPLIAGEGLQTLVLVDPLRGGGEEHRVAVEGNADLSVVGKLRDGSRQDGTGGDAGIDGLLDIGLMGGEEEVGSEGVEVGGDGTAAA